MKAVIRTRSHKSIKMNCTDCKKEILLGSKYQSIGGAYNYHMDCKIAKRKKLFAKTTAIAFIKSKQPGGA